MHTQTSYICDTCGSKFDTEAECIQHETIEHNKYSLMDDKELSNKLREVGESIKPAYRITRPEHTADNSLVYLPTDNLHCLMAEASKRLYADHEGCMSDWISVSDRDPDDEALVLVCNAAGVISMARRRVGCYWNVFLLVIANDSIIKNVFDCDVTCDRIVAWMPLPAPYGNPSFDSLDKEDVCQR